MADSKEDFGTQDTETIPLTDCEKDVKFWKNTALTAIVAFAIYFCLSFVDMVNHNNAVHDLNNLRGKYMDLKDELDAKESARAQAVRQNNVLIAAWNDQKKQTVARTE